GVASMVAVVERAVADNKTRWKNTDAEREYTARLTDRERKRYEKDKKKYRRACDKRGEPDFLDDYIQTVCVTKA
ncbi:MAG: hypothetical protein K2L51_07830, partial [Clostridiales bacterium]|nr:hypothetical protein [Clostridiales bacterium]